MSISLFHYYYLLLDTIQNLANFQLSVDWNKKVRPLLLASYQKTRPYFYELGFIGSSLTRSKTLYIHDALTYLHEPNFMSAFYMRPPFSILFFEIQAFQVLFFYLADEQFWIDRAVLLIALDSSVTRTLLHTLFLSYTNLEYQYFLYKQKLANKFRLSVKLIICHSFLYIVKTFFIKLY